MKKGLICVAAIAFAALAMISCKKDDPDVSLLPGRWEEAGTTIMWVYKDNGRGYTWDPADDVRESEAQWFDWTLKGSTLTQMHEQEMTRAVPKEYTIETLTKDKMVYKDKFKTSTFNRK